MGKLLLGVLEVGSITIDSDTTLTSIRNQVADSKIIEGKPNSFVYFLSPQKIYSDSFFIQLIFIDEKLIKVILRAYSETEEDGMTLAKRHRRWLIGLLGEQLGIKNQIDIDWGIVKPCLDMRSGQSEIHISYY
ncbi:hypothetical protein Q8G35_14710 [Peribacillus simplex]|uniref:Uncharacterized protein n=2 Tax=Peribacillus TaxID=2675229 RepID=A0AA90P5Q4_9BACI|nr:MULTISPECIES: hypothetical protein [Peribacillus]MDP1419631.1 hypothetical protein [Peribacillus simplex]MDP1452716.1 hypothetical protein [Peribacillus frigoritolerans]